MRHYVYAHANHITPLSKCTQTPGCAHHLPTLSIHAHDHLAHTIDPGRPPMRGELQATPLAPAPSLRVRQSQPMYMSPDASVKFQTMRASTSASQKLMRVQQEMMAISMCAPRETLNPTYGSLLWESGGAWNIRSYSQRFDSAQITCLLHGDEARQSKGVCLFLCAEALIGNKEICI